MEYKIKEGVVKTILNYLAGRPYVESFQLIKELQGLEKIEQEKKE
jgi:hypothetical protein